MDMAARQRLPDETPVAITVNGSGIAVMMATPRDLADFGRGFCLGEGIVGGLGEIDEIEVVDHGARGREVRLWIDAARAEAVAARRRHMAGPVGCGLCGIDSLDAAIRRPPGVPSDGPVLSRDDVAGATDALRHGQTIRAAGLHAAACLVPGGALAHLREDVGRHNALDKTLGAALGAGERISALVMSSRVSVDLVQKCAFAGVPALIAVSTPTAQAVRMAAEAGMTLIARARAGHYETFSGAHRVG